MKPRPLYLQTRWVVGHVLILALVVLMLNLGFWQLRRLHETEHTNAQIRARMNAPAVAVTRDNATTLAPYQRVSVDGAWDAPRTYLLRYPLHLGQQGYWVIEPVLLNDGGSVLVNRGWIPQARGQAMTLPTGAEGGSVHIEGTMQKRQTEHNPVGTNGASPPVPTQTAITAPWVQLVAPFNSGDPVPLDPPDLSNGSHLSYTLQWWSFCIIALVGWVALIRHVMQEQAEASDSPRDERAPQ